MPVDEITFLGASRTGLTARWCPVHGDCTCPSDPDYAGPDVPPYVPRLDTPDCPLHGTDSTHADKETDDE